MLEHFTLVAPTKINLFLNIIGKRDHYHLLETLIVFAEYGDAIDIDCGNTNDEVIFINNSLPIPKNNTVSRAIELLRTTSKVSEAVSIKITKNVPIATGLGGGSADAAAVIKFFSNRWNIATDRAYEIARQVGADVSACLTCKPLVARGIGEIIQELPMFHIYPHIVIVNPGIALSTSMVFKQYNGVLHKPLPPIPQSLAELLIYLNEVSSNVLYEPACQLVPEVSQIVSKLSSSSDCVFASMSGSGASCFGIFKSAESAFTVAHTLQKSYPWCIASKILDVETMA